MPCAEEGQTSNKLHTACSICQTEYYDMSNSLEDEAQCEPCPKNAVCDTEGITTASLPLKDGYWRTQLTSTEIYACPIFDGCRSTLANSTHMCAPGYSGIMCALCDDGHFYSKAADKCKTCEEANQFMWIIGAAFIILAVLAVYFLPRLCAKLRCCPGVRWFDIGKFKVRTTVDASPTTRSPSCPRRSCG